MNWESEGIPVEKVPLSLKGFGHMCNLPGCKNKA